MKTPEQPTPSAQEAYEQHYFETCDLILRIAGRLETIHDASQPKNWADVGDLGHVKEDLTHIAEFLGA